MKPPSKPSPPPASGTEWKSAVKKRVQERFEKSTPRNAVPKVAPPVGRVDRPVEAPPVGAASRVPPAAPAQHETSRIPQIAGPYDTTVEMGPARRMASKEKDAEPPAKRVDQIPLFPEQVDKPALPSRKGAGHLADRPIRLGAEASGEEEGEANEPPAGRKAAACILDALLVAIPWAVALFSVERMLGTGIWPLLQQSWIPFVILFVFLHMMYAVFFIPALGETPGMAVSGIRLTGDGRMRWPRTVMFALVCLLSLAAIGSGFIWAVFDPDRRSWPELASNARFTRR
ncbi:MAG: RDD family protein [Acidobacteria bacterium]|nr:RDD family protein [Acidobacteriota bacterium]